MVFRKESNVDARSALDLLTSTPTAPSSPAAASPASAQGSATIAGTVVGMSTTSGAVSSVRSVGMTGSTKFEDTTCTALNAGDAVEVKGTRQADSSVLATKVEKED